MILSDTMDFLPELKEMLIDNLIIPWFKNIPLIFKIGFPIITIPAILKAFGMDILKSFFNYIKKRIKK